MDGTKNTKFKAKIIHIDVLFDEGWSGRLEFDTFKG